MTRGAPRRVVLDLDATSEATPRRIERQQTPFQLQQRPDLGVLCLDHEYDPSPGEVGHPGSFAYPVDYRVVPGLTFAACKAGAPTPGSEVHANLEKAIDDLIRAGVRGITGDCGFMMWFQHHARQRAKLPVFMSPLAQLPAVTCAYAPDEKVLILTTSQKALEPMRDLIRDECGVDTHQQRYVIVGCDDVPGVEAIAAGEPVDVERVTPGIVARVQAALAKDPQVRAVMLECSQMPPFSDALRTATGLPVFDAITCCNMFVAGFHGTKRPVLHIHYSKQSAKKYELSGQKLASAAETKAAAEAVERQRREEVSLDRSPTSVRIPTIFEPRKRTSDRPQGRLAAARV